MSITTPLILSGEKSTTTDYNNVLALSVGSIFYVSDGFETVMERLREVLEEAVALITESHIALITEDNFLIEVEGTDKRSFKAYPINVGTSLYYRRGYTSMAVIENSILSN